MTTPVLKRVNYYDFQKVDVEDLTTDQSFHIGSAASVLNSVAGSGVLLDFPQEPIIFDSNDLDSFQQGLVAINAFDGVGILSAPYNTSDAAGGNQLSVTISGARIDGFINTLVFIIGKTFDSSLIYEVVELNSNMTALTNNHFIEITNLLLQNFRGNSNTSVDGYGSYDVGGRLVIAEAASMKPARGLIADQFTIEPDIFWRNFKTNNSGKDLRAIVVSAIGASNNIDDLNINTTAAKTRVFSEGGNADIIYAEKFKLQRNNIQKITILLSMASQSDWSGSIVLGLRPLQKAATSVAAFLPDDEIGFDPSTETLEEIVLTQSDLAEQGIVLTVEPQPVDFVFTGSNLSNVLLSNLIINDYYAITVRRAGSSALGTIVLQEARNNDSMQRRLSVFSSGVWTDVKSSTLWYRIWSDSATAASGASSDAGIRLISSKTELNDDGVIVQSPIAEVDFANTSEDTENYLLVRKSIVLTDVEAHPRTGDKVSSRAKDVPSFSLMEQSDVFELIDEQVDPVILGRFKDLNPRANPIISGSTQYPGLVLGNVFTIINPGSDLLTHNVVGSILTPNTARPDLQYRIVAQNTFTDLIGDVNGDGLINLDDAALVDILDGYALDLSGGSIAPAHQKAAILAGNISLPVLIRADVSGDGLINATDTVDINAFISDGTALPAGSSITRMELTLEPLIRQWVSLNSNATSSLHLEVADATFVNNVSFSVIPFTIKFVPVWYAENVEVLDLRRYVTTTFTKIVKSNLQSVPETGGSNDTFIPGNIFLTGAVQNLDSTPHKLDYESATVELELPTGNTRGEFNIFDTYIVDKMKFSDGTLVSASAINDNQVRFEINISSYSKNIDGYDFDDGYGNTTDEVIGTFMDHSTGLLRLDCQNVVNNLLFPEIRTRISVSIALKRAGFSNADVFIDATTLSGLIS